MANWKESTIFALNMGKLIYKNSKNKWHMIKANPCFGAWHMINYSSTADFRNKDMADEDAYANILQHQQTRFLNRFGEDGLKDKKYRFPVKSRERMLNDRLENAWDNLFNISKKLPMREDISPQDMLKELYTIIEVVSKSFYSITDSDIDCVEDVVTKEDDDSVFELKDKLNDNAFISRELMLIDKLSEASGDFFKIYHKLLIIKKAILTKPVQDLSAELDTIHGMIWKSILKIDCAMDEEDD